MTICTVVSACIRYEHCSLNLLVCTNGLLGLIAQINEADAL